MLLRHRQWLCSGLVLFSLFLCFLPPLSSLTFLPASEPLHLLFSLVHCTVDKHFYVLFLNNQSPFVTQPTRTHPQGLSLHWLPPRPSSVFLLCVLTPPVCNRHIIYRKFRPSFIHFSGSSAFPVLQENSRELGRNLFCSTPLNTGLGI